MSAGTWKDSDLTRPKESNETLLRGPLLIEAQKWFDRRSQDLSNQEQKFISASREEKERLAREEKERQERELEAVQRLARAASVSRERRRGTSERAGGSLSKACRGATSPRICGHRSGAHSFGSPRTIGLGRNAHVTDQHRRKTLNSRIPYDRPRRHGFPYILCPISAAFGGQHCQCRKTSVYRQCNSARIAQCRAYFPEVSTIPIAASAIIAVAIQPSIFKDRGKVNLPITFLWLASSIIKHITGAAVIPLMVAAQTRALMGSNFVKFKTSPIRVAKCEKTRPDDPQTEKQRSEGSCNWLERLSSLCGAIDIRFSMCMKRRSGSQYDEIGNEIGKCHSNISIYFVRWNCPGASCGIFFRGFSFGSLSICSTSSPDCQNSRYGLIVVPKTAINAAKYSPLKEIVGIKVPRSTSPQSI
jgi:hypothetical protein